MIEKNKYLTNNFSNKHKVIKVLNDKPSVPFCSGTYYHEAETFTVTEKFNFLEKTAHKEVIPAPSKYYDVLIDYLIADYPNADFIFKKSNIANLSCLKNGNYLFDEVTQIPIKQVLVDNAKLVTFKNVKNFDNFKGLLMHSDAENSFEGITYISEANNFITHFNIQCIALNSLGDTLANAEKPLKKDKFVLSGVDMSAMRGYDIFHVKHLDFRKSVGFSGKLNLQNCQLVDFRGADLNKVDKIYVGSDTKLVGITKKVANEIVFYRMENSGKKKNQKTIEKLSNIQDILVKLGTSKER